MVVASVMGSIAEMEFGDEFVAQLRHALQIVESERVGRAHRCYETSELASRGKFAARDVADGQSEEVVRDGILVNAVAPSTLDTPANRKAMPRADHTAWAGVEDVAKTIVFLASPDNRVTRGGIVPARSRRTTLSQSSARAGIADTSAASSARSAVLRRELWHVTQ